MTKFLTADGKVVRNADRVVHVDTTLTTADGWGVRKLMYKVGSSAIKTTANKYAIKVIEPLYAEATIDSMIDPQAYGAGTYPYGFCATSGGDTFQVNKVTGTANDTTHADWDNLGAGIKFTPIATPTELNMVRANQTNQTFGEDTPWEALYSTTGLAGHYIQVQDIDLEYDTQNAAGLFYNAGAGWNPIGIYFIGFYDGGGRTIDGMFTTGQSLFLTVGYNVSRSVVKNLIMTNVVINSGRYASAFGGRTFPAAEFHNCISTGLIYSTAQDIGGIAGGRDGGKFYNCFSSCVMRGTYYVSGICGLDANIIHDCMFVGYTTGTHSSDFTYGIGRIADVQPGQLENSYYNNTVFQPSHSSGGVPKTTAELLALDAATSGWDTDIWEFRPGRYPIHKFFGELSINRPPPTALAITDVGGGNWKAEWTAPTLTPKGYYLYVSFDNGAWAKVQSALITATSLTFTAPTTAGTYNYFVTAEYNVLGRLGQTGNSVTTSKTIT